MLLQKTVDSSENL